MAFKDIKGQDRIIEFFRNSLNNQRLAHAYLFSGGPGLGKGLVAKTLAKFLNCERPIKKNDWFVDCCDACISCIKVDGFNHPDVNWIKARSESKKISIDEIRSMQKKIYLKAYEGKFKIFIILDAQNMTEQAANSLLKTLEEPPAMSLLILTSKNISGLLPTIISRCQIVKFYPLKIENLQQILIKDYKLDAKGAHFLSLVSEGRLGSALSLREKDTLNKKNRIIDQICSTGRGLTSSEVFNIKDKRELEVQIKYLLDWFRDILIYKSGLSAASIINADRMESIKSYASFFSLQELEQIINKIIEAHRLIEQNVSPKIALEAMLVRIKRCRR